MFVRRPPAQQHALKQSCEAVVSLNHEASCRATTNIDDVDTANAFETVQGASVCSSGRWHCRAPAADADAAQAGRNPVGRSARRSVAQVGRERTDGGHHRCTRVSSSAPSRRGTRCAPAKAEELVGIGRGHHHLLGGGLLVLVLLCSGIDDLHVNRTTPRARVTAVSPLKASLAMMSRWSRSS
jgi:hypothetical protein